MKHSGEQLIINYKSIAPSPRKTPNIKTEHYATINVNPTGGGGSVGKGRGFDA